MAAGAILGLSTYTDSIVRDQDNSMTGLKRLIKEVGGDDPAFKDLIRRVDGLMESNKDLMRSMQGDFRSLTADIQRLQRENEDLKRKISDQEIDNEHEERMNEHERDNLDAEEKHVEAMKTGITNQYDAWGVLYCRALGIPFPPPQTMLPNGVTPPPWPPKM